MNRPLILTRPSRCSGFTLVELLVVMGIIAILAAVTLSTGTAVIRAAKRTLAANTATQIQTACLAYYTEYSVYPVPTTQTTDYLIGDTSSGDGGSWATLICTLCGNVHPSDGTAFTPAAAGPLNSRAIAFLSMKSSDVFTAKDVTSNANAVKDAPKNPLPTSSSANLFFNIVMDADYSGVIGDSASALSGKLPNWQLSSSEYQANPKTFTTLDMTGTTTGGIAVWADCNSTTGLNAPNGYVHTY